MNDFINTGRRIICKKHLVESCHECTGQKQISYGTNGTIDKNNTTNQILGGRVGGGRVSFYNPHNARFYFLFDKWNFRPDFSFQSLNSGSEKVLVRDGFRFAVKSKTIEVTNKLNSQRRFKIDGDAEQRKARVFEAEALLESEAIAALRLFVQDFGGSCDFVPFKRWIPDNKILDEPIVESIPDDVRFRNDVVKKEYMDNIEYSTPNYAANAFANFGLMDFNPRIEEGLQKIDSDLLTFRRDALEPLTMQIKLHLEVMSDMKNTLKDIRASLPAINSPRTMQAKSVKVAPCNNQASAFPLPTISKYDSRQVINLKLAEEYR